MDKFKMDQEESLSQKIEGIFKEEVNSTVVLPVVSKIGDLINNVKKFIFENKHVEFKESESITVLDPAMQVDGSFLVFCEEKNLTAKTLSIDAISVLSFCDKEFDPFILHGCLLVKANDFHFIKSSLLQQTTQGTDNLSSFVILAKNDYKKYIDLKIEYIKWLKYREGVVVRVLGGEDYLQDLDRDWDNLFFGEKQNIKDEVKSIIDKFFSSKEYYAENNLPWHFSLFIEGPANCGKTTLLNTIISEYELDPVTVEYFNTDDSVLNALFKTTEGKQKNIVFIDDIDNFVDQQFITPEFFFELLSSYKANNGNLLVFLGRKMPDFFKELNFLFDKSINVGSPEYTNCLNKLFDKYISAANIKDLIKISSANDLSYGYIRKMYMTFMKRGEEVIKTASKKDNYNELTNILKNIIKEDEKLNKSKLKKVGLLGKK